MSSYAGQLISLAPGVLRVTRVVVLVGALIVLGMVAAKLFWVVVAGPSPQALQVTRQIQSSSSVPQITIDASILSQVTPFKRSNKEEPIPIEIAEEAPETQLNLTLKGVRTDGDGEGVAFIKGEDGKDHRYRRGDEIQGLSGVTVDRVYADGVILSRNGLVEKLTTRSQNKGIIPVSEARLERDAIVASDQSGQVHSASSSSVAIEAAAKPTSKQRSVSARLSREELQNIFRWARFDASTVGNVQGVTVFPTNASIFQKSGMKARDIVQSIGGIRLDESTDYKRLISEVRDQERIEISLLRGGETVKLAVRITED